MQIAEPVGKTSDINMELLISKARNTLKAQKNQSEERNLVIDIKKILITSELSMMKLKNYDLELGKLVLTSISQMRVSKKKPQLIIDEHMQKVSSLLSKKMMIGEISLDFDDWEMFISTHESRILKYHHACGLILKTTDTLASISAMLSHEEDFKEAIYSYLHYIGLGISVSNINSVFIVLIVVDIA